MNLPYEVLVIAGAFTTISAISLITLAILVKRAPLGWQDKHGFHFGVEPYQSMTDAADQSTSSPPNHHNTPRSQKGRRCDTEL